MEIVSVGHTNSLARVEFAWVKYPRSFFLGHPRRFPTKTLDFGSTTKVTHNKLITQMNVDEK